ncbi:MAG: pitrilysin family protein [Chthoniobacterales bacterium]
MQTQLSRLDNGIRVATCEMPHAQTVTVGIWAAVGGRYEPAHRSGIAHFIEHLLFKGTKKRSARQISQAVEGIGGYLNAFTSEESTCYLASSAAEHFPRVFSVLADMYLEPRFAPADIERERGVIGEEILMYRDDPSQYVHELLSDVYWPDHPLGRQLTGSVKTIEGMHRKDFLDFRSQHYHGGNTVITAAGKVSHEKLVETVDKLFRSLKRKPKSKFLPAPAPRRSVKVKTAFRDIEQTNAAFALPAFSIYDSRRYALNLLNIILGGNMSSRLFQEIREKRGYCYSISSHASLFHDTGTFGITAGLDRKNLEKSIQLILREFERLRERPVGPSELRRAKDYAIGSSRMSLERTSSQNSRLGYSILTHDRLVDSESIHEKLRAVTAEEIQKVAQTILRPDRLTLAVVGPVKDEDAVRQLLLKNIA